MDQDTAKVLNELIQTSKDGQKGFAKAAEETTEPQLKHVFLECARRCEQGAKELQDKVREFGAKPEKGGSALGAAHRGWLDVKAAATGRDAKAILEEVERGEDYAKGKYNEALGKDDLPLDVREILTRQYQGLVANHDRVRELRNRYRST